VLSGQFSASDVIERIHRYPKSLATF